MTQIHEGEVRERRPGRPLGLSLAIIASALLFAVLPLLQVGFALSFQARFSALGDTEFNFPGEDPTEPFASGVSMDGVDTVALLVQGGVSLLFLGVCVLAWIGRPGWIRFVLLAAVLILALLSLVVLIAQLNMPPSLEDGLTSADDLGRNLRWTEIAFTILIPLYVAWYLNRAPSRAFYRGRYLSAPLTVETRPGA
jgi:hypothetical protein